MKNAKKNPYAKKQTKKLRITRKQWTRILCLGIVLALVVGLAIITRSGINELGDDHAGHNHDEGTGTTADPHAGHNHAAGDHNSANAKLVHRVYTNSDKTTYNDAIYNSKNELLLKRDSLPYEPYKTTDECGLTLFYCKTAEYGYTSGDSIYGNEKTEKISDVFHGVLATDGVRVAYCSADDTKVIVQDIFNKETYYKEYDLPGVVENGYKTVQHSTLSSDKKTVTVTYATDTEGGTARHSINLYE